MGVHNVGCFKPVQLICIQAYIAYILVAATRFRLDLGADYQAVRALSEEYTRPYYY